jgi:iron complex transport system substrate-binding protein
MRLTMLLLLMSASLFAQPQRIVSTGPGITEILFALGLGPKVVGVTQYCNYPPEAQKVRRIGTWMTPNLEAILASRPDLVVVQSTKIHDDARYKALSLKTLVVELDSLNHIAASIKQIGVSTGTQTRAAELVAQIERDLTAVRKRVAGKKPPRVMFVVGRTPGALEGIIAAGNRSYLTEVMQVAGGQNIFDDSIVPYAKVSLEEVLARKPEVVIDMGEHPEAGAIDEAQKRKEIALYQRYPTLPAAKDNRIHIVSSDLFVHPGPRVVDLARTLEKLFHPSPSKP